MSSEPPTADVALKALLEAKKSGEPDALETWEKNYCVSPSKWPKKILAPDDAMKVIAQGLTEVPKDAKYVELRDPKSPGFWDWVRQCNLEYLQKSGTGNDDPPKPDEEKQSTATAAVRDQIHVKVQEAIELVNQLEEDDEAKQALLGALNASLFALGQCDEATTSG